MNKVILAKEGIAELKKAEILVVRLLIYPISQIEWDTLNEILFLIRDVGGRTKEYQESRGYKGGFRQWKKKIKITS